MSFAVKAENVSKGFGKSKVLQKVSFEVARGEIFGLLGPNGAGKSTLLNILCGIQSRDSGKISFFDGSPNVNVRKSIALVPQEFAFYKNFTVFENFLFFGSSVGLRGKKLRERIDFLLQWLGLKEFKNKRAGLLSGGFKRLLNVGLSLLWEPKLVFLDEVTVGLDPKMRALVWERIRQLKSNGMTVVLTTHYMEEAQALCDRVCLLHKGAIAAIGTSAELIERFGGNKILVFVLDKEVGKEVEAEIMKFAGVQIISMNGNAVVVASDSRDVLALSGKIRAFFEQSGFNVIKSNIKEPSLEQVFINLTGSDLRE